LATAEKEEKTMFELQSKYESVLEAYNKEVQKIIKLETKVMGRSTRPRFTYPHPPCEPFMSIPLIEMLDIPQRPLYYTAGDFEEEKNKLWTLHVEMNVQYEDKLRKALMYLVDKI
jgi:DNA polymerase III delta prime subunit